jgi:hemoglobin/transferrin/lactoferrin receptor protein
MHTQHNNMNMKNWLRRAALLTLALGAVSLEAAAAQGEPVNTAKADASQPSAQTAQETSAGASTASANAPAGTVDAAHRLAPVVVTATRLPENVWDVPGSTSVIRLEDIITNGAISLGDALRYVPGVVVPFAAGASTGAVPYVTGGEKTINIRGLEDNRVAILADGIPQPDDFTAGTGQGFASPGRVYFDPATLAQVEIFKTASSSLYGSGALNGVIGTRTLSPSDLLGPSLKGRALENTIGYATANSSLHNLARGAVGDGDWAASAVHSYRKGHELETRGKDRLNPTDYQSQAVVAKVNRKYETAKLEATVDYYRVDEFVNALNASGVMNMGPMRYEYLAPTQDTDRERIRLSLAADLTPKKGTNALYDSLGMIGYWQRATSKTVNPSTTRIVRPTGTTERVRVNTLSYSTDTVGLQANARKDFLTSSVAHTLQYGVDVSHGDTSSDFTRIENGIHTGDPTAMAPSEVWRAGAFISDRLTFGQQRRLSLTPSLRADYFCVNPDNTEYYVTFAGTRGKTYENFAVSPGLSAIYRVTDGLNVYGLYAMGTRNPSADELNGSFIHSGSSSMAGSQLRTYPNPNLKNETSNNFELGVSGNLGGSTFRLAGYYNLYKDFIDTMHNTGQTDDDGYLIYRSRNLDDVTIHGIEISWDWRIQKRFMGGIDGFLAGASFTWSEGRQNDGDRRQPLESIEPMRFIFYFGYAEPGDKWGARLTGTFVARKSSGDIPTEEDGTPYFREVASYFTLDLAGYYRFDEHWSLNAGITNLTDREYTTWSTIRAGASGMSGKTFTQPGVNGYISLTAKF